MKPRAFSGREVRHRSSAPAAHAAMRSQLDGLAARSRGRVERVLARVEHDSTFISARSSTHRAGFELPGDVAQLAIGVDVDLG